MLSLIAQNMAQPVHIYAPNPWLIRHGGTETDLDMLLILLAGYTYFVAINVGAFLAIAWDKRQARCRGRRMSEAKLIALAAIGGWLGAKLGQQMLRHKTRRRPVSMALSVAPLGHMAFAVLAFVALVPLAG
jgi:uncharacterized membrane protein YsdA (DUF1294 family)